MTLYSQSQDTLLRAQLDGLGDGAQLTVEEAGGRITRCRYEWPDLQITINSMDPSEIPGHVAGFERYARQLAGARDAEAGPVIERIRATRMVLGFVASTDLDEDSRMERLEELLLTLCERTGSLLFWQGDLYDSKARPLIPDSDEETPDVFDEGSEDSASDELDVADSAEWQPSPAQVARFERSRAILDERQIPRYRGPLFTSDDDEVALRPADEVARRTLVLWIVALYSEGMPQEEAWELLDRWQLWPTASPEETRYLREEDPDPDEMEGLVWRLEAVWTLLWCLGVLDDLGWAASMCDVPRLVELMKPIEADAEAFIANASLRPPGEILDAVDLTMRLHWTVRDAWIAGRPIRSDLDWTKGEPDMPVVQSPAVGVIEQRHQTLNWVTQFSDAGWDHVDTPT